MKIKTTATNGGFWKVHELPTYVPGNWLRGSAVTKNCPFSLALTGAELQDSLPLIRYQWLLPVAMNRVFPGWTQDDSYRRRRSGRTERGSCIQSSLERTAYPELSVRRGMRQTRP